MKAKPEENQTPSLQDDVIDVLESSRSPLSLEEVVADVRVWPLSRGDLIRKCTKDEVSMVLEFLKTIGVAESHVSGYRLKVVVEPSGPQQKSLF